MKKVLLLLAILALLPALPAAAESFTVGGAHLENLGMQTGWTGGGSFDIFDVVGSTGAAAVTTPWSFQVGYNAWDPQGPTDYNLTRSITLLGTSFDITQTLRITIGAADTLQLFAATILQTIGGRLFAITATGFGPFTFGLGTWSGNVQVSVEERSPSQVPEPASLLLLGTGLIGLARFSRKRVQSR